jgi:competence protein ComEC
LSTFTSTNDRVIPYFPPLAIYTIGWLIGIGIAPLVPQPLWAWGLLSGAGAGGAWLARRDPGMRNFALAVVMLGLGAIRWGWAQPVYDESFVGTYNDKGFVTFEGVVIDEPDTRDTYVNLRVAIDTLLPDGATQPVAAHGVVLAQVQPFPAFQYGDRLRVSGELQTPPVFEDFSYADYLARQGVYSLVRRARADPISNSPILRLRSGQVFDPLLNFQITIFKPLFAFKARALAAIAAVFPEPQGALLSGILLGVETGIPESLKDAFRKTGTSHIVAISGFNVSILAGVFLALFRRILGERRARLPTLITLVLYAVLAGADASVVRATIMGGLVLLAGGFNRPANGLALLAASALLMTAYNPGTLWDVGFQLSVAATLGLILYATPFTQAATRFLSRWLPENIVGPLTESVTLTLAAQLTTLPLIAYYFHQLSLISLVANAIILPAQPAVMILGGIATLGALVAQPLGALLAWLAWPFVTFTIAVVELLAKVPGAAIQLDRFPLAALFVMYGVIAALTWRVGRNTESRPAWRRAWAGDIVVGLTAIVALAAWNVYLHAPDGKLHLTFFDVGHGDAILIQTPGGRYALIDGGPSPNGLADSLGRALPIGMRTLDLVVAASTKAESLGGLPALLDRYTIRRAVMAGQAARHSAYREWTEGLASRSIPALSAEVGQQFDLGEGAMLIVVDVQDEGAALRLDYGRASFLMPIKAATTEAASPATVLFAPDHGGAESITANFVAAVNARAIVVSVGAGNPSGDPQPDTLALFEGRTVLRTDEHGTIAFVTDGERLWLTAEK